MADKLESLIEKLEGRAPTDRLVVMAQNPANNHHWSLGLGMVSVAELLAELTFARDVRRSITNWAATAKAEAPTQGEA